jgi:AbrB family looped-hinge helix DNA binding protein
MSEPIRRTVQVAENGRMNLPADMRRGLGLNGPGRVILTQDEDGIRITTADQAIRRIRALAAPFAQGQASVVDEFLAERRAEAAREEDEDPAAGRG